MTNDWKDRLGVVFSTNQDYNYEYDEPQEQETVQPGQQKLRVTIEKKGRGGKVATIVKGFVGTDADRGKLEKMLKTKCGVGGSSKDGLIILQGDIRSVTKSFSYLGIWDIPTRNKRVRHELRLLFF